MKSSTSVPVAFRHVYHLEEERLFFKMSLLPCYFTFIGIGIFFWVV